MTRSAATRNGAARIALIWAAIATVITVPIVLAAMSPLLAWRSAIYISAGFAGIAAFGLLLLQPLLMGGYLPGLNARTARQAHRWTGALLVAAVLLHVGGLWITSPPDVIDALTFASPTPFSDWGVIAMWALFATALFAAFRRKLHLRPQTWRFVHGLFAIIITIGTIVHALLIEGTMETYSKIALSTLVFAATMKAIIDLKLWGIWARRRKQTPAQ